MSVTTIQAIDLGIVTPPINWKSPAGFASLSRANLVAIARTVAMVWKQDQLAREAVEIGRAGAELYDRLAVAADHLAPAR